MLEVIEGQEYIIEDAQFALGYASSVRGLRAASRGISPTFIEGVEIVPEVRSMIQKMEEVKATAQELYDKTFNCRRARERAGFEVSR